jgi:hypothetical protein
MEKSIGKNQLLLAHQKTMRLKWLPLILLQNCINTKEPH